MAPDHKQEVLEKLAQLREEYRASLPVELAAIALESRSLRDTPSPDQLQNIHRRLHKLAGSAGSFGFPQLSVRARELEIVLQNWLKGREPDAVARAQLVAELSSLEIVDDTGTAVPDTPEIHRELAFADGHNLVYVVESDHNIAGELKVALGNFGYRVRHFSQLEQARQAIVEQRPDFLIADVGLAHDGGQGPAAGSALASGAQ